MSAELPPDIRVVEDDGTTRYVLPRPALGMARMMGGILFAFGLFPIGMGAWFIDKVARDFGPGHDPFVIGRALMLLCPGSFILIGGLISLLGVWLLAGRSEIVLTADEISSAFRLGTIAWRGRRRRTLVRRLVVERSTRGPGPGAELASLFAETDAGRPLVLAFVYSPSWLTPLAADLARRWDTGEGPLPVIERAAGQASSLRWRRDQQAAWGRKPVPGCFLFVWGTGFFAAGLGAFVLILQSLLSGDPGGALQGDFPWKWLWILFPLPFIVPGAGALLYAFSRRKKVGLSPEQLKAEEAKAPAPAAEAGGLAAPPPAPESEYPTIPAVSRAPGAELPVRLASTATPGTDLVVLIVVFVCCSGVLTPLVRYAVRGVLGANWEWAPMAVIFSIVLGLMWVFFAAALWRTYRLWRIGSPAVEVSALPLYCGDACEVTVTVPGPATLPRLRIAVVCEEEASYTEGTTTRKEIRRVYDKELASLENFAIEGGEPLRVRGAVFVPAGAMHSFKGAHNEVRWVVRVEGDAQRLFRLAFAHDYRLEVRPRRESGGTT